MLTVAIDKCCRGLKHCHTPLVAVPDAFTRHTTM